MVHEILQRHHGTYRIRCYETFFVSVIQSIDETNHTHIGDLKIPERG